MEINNRDNIYVLKTYGSNGRVLYKLGYSSNIENRLVSYFSANPFIEVVNTYYFENGFEFEQYIHNNFKATIRREWYDEETIINIMDNIELIYAKGLDSTFNKRKIFTSFKGLYEDYLENYNNDVIRDEYELEYPEFADFKRYLTVKEMNTKRWVKERLLELVNDYIEVDDILFNFGRKYKTKTLSVAEINKQLGERFKERGINIKPKATMLENSDLVKVSKTQVMNSDNKRVTALKFN